MSIQSRNTKFDSPSALSSHLIVNDHDFDAMWLHGILLPVDGDTSLFNIRGYLLIGQGKICSQHVGFMRYLWDELPHSIKDIYRFEDEPCDQRQKSSCFPTQKIWKCFIYSCSDTFSTPTCSYRGFQWWHQLCWWRQGNGGQVASCFAGAGAEKGTYKKGIVICCPEGFHAREMLYTYMMTSSNGHIFRDTALCEWKSPVTGSFHWQRPVTRSFDGFFYQRLGINGWANMNFKILCNKSAHFPWELNTNEFSRS